MQRRMGMESMMGIGGGMVSKESQQYLEQAEDFIRKKKIDRALPLLEQALATGGENLDAIVRVSELLEDQEAIETLKNARARGERLLKECLGDDCFDDSSDCVGNFWPLLETRPYMRVLLALSQRYYLAKQFNESAEVMCEMLRLRPMDNIGVRSLVPTILCLAGRYADAVSFVSQWLTPQLMKSGNPAPRGGTVFSAPKKGSHLIRRNVTAQDTKYSWAPIPYSGALAAFKIWGDCPDSRAYLEFAVKCNPHILLKVLARVHKPETFSKGATRTRNGPDEARDYLWLVQDMWMDPEVWAWVDSNRVVKEVLLKKCGRDACTTKETRVGEFKRCAGCQTVSYCGVPCQRLHWPYHKSDCKEQRAYKERMRATEAMMPAGRAPSLGQTNFRFS